MTISGRTMFRPGVPAHVERFLVDSFTLPRSSTGGTATNNINIDLREIAADTRFKSVEIRIYDLRTATTFPVGTPTMVAALSTDAGVTSFTGGSYVNTLVANGSATLVVNSGLQGAQNFLTLDHGGAHEYHSATQTAGSGHRLRLKIENLAMATALKTAEWEWAYLASASHMVVCHGLGQCSSTLVFNGVRILGNSGNPSWYQGAVEVWAERLHYSGVSP